MSNALNDDSPTLMISSAPYPTELADLVRRARIQYPQWVMQLEDSTHDGGEVAGLRLAIIAITMDSYHPTQRRGTHFGFPVPAATYNRASWQRWLFDRLMDVHAHEAGEALAFAYQDVDGTEFLARPFAPQHGPGRDPHRNVEVGVDPMEQRVNQSGGRNPGEWYAEGVVGLHGDEVHDQHSCVLGCIPVQVVVDVDHPRAS